MSPSGVLKKSLTRTNLTASMKKLSNKIIFYFVIMEENKTDHKNLRHLIRSLVPQAIIESIYDFNEAIYFFKENTLKPHLLFLSDEMSKTGLNVTADGYVNSVLLDEMPLVFLSEKKSIKQSFQHTLSKPYNPKGFLSLVDSLNQKWLT